MTVQKEASTLQDQMFISAKQSPAGLSVTYIFNETSFQARMQGTRVYRYVNSVRVSKEQQFEALVTAMTSHKPVAPSLDPEYVEHLKKLDPHETHVKFCGGFGVLEREGSEYTVLEIDGVAHEPMPELTMPPTRMLKADGVFDLASPNNPSFSVLGYTTADANMPHHRGMMDRFVIVSGIGGINDSFTAAGRKNLNELFGKFGGRKLDALEFDDLVNHKTFDEALEEAYKARKRDKALRNNAVRKQRRHLAQVGEGLMVLSDVGNPQNTGNCKMKASKVRKFNRLDRIARILEL